MSNNTICIKTKDELLNSTSKYSSFSIIIPTFNESSNIINLINSIKKNIDGSIFYELVIVDDSSTDGTITKVFNSFNESKGFIIYMIKDFEIDEQQKNYLIYPNKNNINFIIKIIIRNKRSGIVSAIKDGVKSSIGDYAIIMDADMSHSPSYLNLLIKEIKKTKNDIVIASRYVKNGKILGWSKKRIFYSKAATFISKSLFKLNNITDPMSGFFIIKSNILKNMKFDTAGYKVLLEILVKVKNIKSSEIPYTFVDRVNGSSKLNSRVVLDFFKGIIVLYNNH